MLICSGVAYVFLTADGGASWSQQQRLAAPDGAAGDQFGASVAVHGGSIACAARYDDDSGADAGIHLSAICDPL